MYSKTEGIISLECVQVGETVAGIQECISDSKIPAVSFQLPKK
jgi:hypothetical protein